MARRRIRWPAIVATAIMLTAIVWLLVNPSVLAPAATRLVNRQLQARIDGKLTVGGYRVRPLVGLDAYNVSLALEGKRGGLTQVVVDTLELDFRLREVLGRTVRLRRLIARGVEVYHNQDRPEETSETDRRRDRGLPSVQIDLGMVQGRHIEISDHQGRARERIPGFAWRGELTGDGRTLTVVTRSGRLDWPSRSSRFDRIYGSIVADESGVRTDGLSVAWNEGEVTLDGGFDDRGLDLNARGRDVNATDVTDLTGVPLDFVAAGDVDIHVAVHNDTTRLEADFSGRFDAWDCKGVRGEAVITREVAYFPVLRGQIGGAHFDGELTVDVRDPANQIITLVGDGRDLDLKTGLIPEVDIAELPRTAGRGRLEIVHTTGNEATHVRGMLLDGEVEIMPFDTCWVDVWARQDSLHFRDIDLRRGSVRAHLVGSSDQQEVFAGSMRLTVGDLRDLPATWGWPVVTGRARGRVNLAGRIDALQANGNVSYQELVIGPVAARQGEAQVAAERVLGEDWTLDMAATGPGFGLGGVALGSYVLRGSADATSAAVDSFQTVRGDTVTVLRGRAEFAGTRADLMIEDLSLTVADTRWRIDRAFETTVAPGVLRVPRLHLVSPQGDLLAEADYDAERRRLAGRLELHNFDLNLLDPFLDSNLRPGGQATAMVTVSGTPQVPEVLVEGGISDATFALAEIETLSVAARLRNGVVKIDSLSLASDYGLVGVRGTVTHPDVPLSEFWPDADLDLAIDIEAGDLTFLQQFELEALLRISGRIDGRLHAVGTTRSPSIGGPIESGPFGFHWLSLDRLTGHLHADRRQLTLSDLAGRQDTLELSGRLEVPLDFDLLTVPESPPDGPFLAHIVIPEDSDLAPLQDATLAFTRVSGRGGGELIISGPLSRPQYQGTMKVRDAGFVLRGNEEVFHDCATEGVFRGDRLLLDRITGKEGLRGTFVGSGHLLFDGLILKTWDIGFRGDRLLVASIPDLRAVVNTDNGRLTGVPVGPDSTLVPRFTGDYRIQKGRYTGTFADPGVGVPDPTLGTIAPDWLADLRITGAPRSARIVNDTMELDLSGDVTLVRDADGMVLNGRMNIDSGRLPVFHNTFKVVRGQLDFSREVGVIPDVDLDAETRVRVRNQVAATSVVERITVNATGPAHAMTISYSSESGYPREAIERMLLGLSPYPDEKGDQGGLTDASIGAGFNLLEREIAREIDLFDTIEIDQIQRQQEGSLGLDPLIGVGKYLGNDLYIKYAQGLNQNDRDILIEYQINRLLLLQTEMRRRIDEYQGDPSYNLDLKYRYEY